MNKQIAIFSDIHGNYQALNAILKDIKKRKIDNVYCLGDTIGIGPNPKECLDLIINNNIKMVLGNHELYYLNGTSIDNFMDESEKEHHRWIKKQLGGKHKEFLNNCELKITKQIDKYTISFQHFLFNNTDNQYPFEDIKIINDNMINLPDSDITFIGHYHNPFELNINKKRLIDVGSSGCTKDENTFYAILLIKDNKLTIERIDLTYNRKEFEQNFNNISYPDKETIGKIFFGIIKNN